MRKYTSYELLIHLIIDKYVINNVSLIFLYDIILNNSLVIRIIYLSDIILILC